MEPSRVVLASTKNFYHRIYVGKGVYAEVTLYWKDKEFKKLEWTFPDYRTFLYHSTLTSIRDIYMKQLIMPDSDLVDLGGFCPFFDVYDPAGDGIAVVKGIRNDLAVPECSE